MNTDTNNPNKQPTPMDSLKTLLEKQVEMIKKNNFLEVENMAGQADLLIDEIAGTPLSQRSQWKEKGRQVTKLYKKLTLMIEAEKDLINKQQRKIGNGKKTIRAYQHKI